MDQLLLDIVTIHLREFQLYKLISTELIIFFVLLLLILIISY